MTRNTSRLSLFVLGLGILLLAQPLAAAGVKSEYFSRLGSIHPRSAKAHVELAGWCKSQGLEAEAQECFQKALEIDSDCEAARTALGFRRYGTGWRKEGEKGSSYPKGRPGGLPPAPLPLPVVPELPGAPIPEGAPGATPGAGEAPETPPPAAAPAQTAAPSEPPAAPKPEPAPEPRNPDAPAPAGAAPPPSATSQAEAISAELARKKAWAQGAAEKLQTAFSTVEDADFLVHSTLPANSAEVKRLLNTLKSARKVLGTVIGATGGTKIWPEKLQFVLLKSEPEYERFANMVDGLPSAKNPDGLYTFGDHTAVANPDSEALWRVAGEQSLKRLGGSDRWVAWWLEQGIGELLLAQSPGGQKKQHYQKTLLYAADVINADGEALKIFNILETASYKDREQTKSRALALSLVDFLQKKSRAGLQGFIKALKSEASPPPPASKSKEEFNAFHLSYIAFQDKSLETSFNAKVHALGEQWKRFTLQTAENLRAADEAKDDAKTKAKQGKAKKGGQGG